MLRLMEAISTATYVVNKLLMFYFMMVGLQFGMRCFDRKIQMFLTAKEMYYFGIFTMIKLL